MKILNPAPGDESEESINERRERCTLRQHDEQCEEQQNTEDGTEPPFFSDSHKRPQLAEDRKAAGILPDCLCGPGLFFL